ncbi:hypothetical protein [Flavobacterium sp. I-STPA6A]|nr:hypothetical protein [Flavobacterium sp. I-STPA6A]
MNSGLRKSNLNHKSTINKNELSQIVFDSFSYFNQNVSFNDIASSKAYQRDYIYYGITNKESKGALNQNVTDYIDYLEINPNIYFKLALNAGVKGNPSISNETVTQTKRQLSTQELIDRMWTKGAYEFRFEIFSENSSSSSSIIIPVKPSDIWNFNINHTRENGTVFRSSKNTYKINPANFTSKVYRLNDMVAFNKWDISNESLHRFINVSEVNLTESITEEVSYTVSKIAEGKFEGSVKFGVGPKTSAELGGSGSYKQETTQEKKFSRRFNVGDDVLATSIKVYFYNPIINNIGNNGECDLFYYSTGAVKFSIIPKIQ